MARGYQTQRLVKPAALAVRQQRSQVLEVLLVRSAEIVRFIEEHDLRGKVWDASWAAKDR